MPRPWKVIERDSASGLELRTRDVDDFMILDRGRVLMSSLIHRSEVAVAELACEAITDRARPRVLIGGLGLGFTLRAALDKLPARAEVVVAELNEVVVRWCQGPARHLTKDALGDPRVRTVVGDVSDQIREAARAGAERAFDAIVLDLYVGPGESAHETEPFFGTAILHQTQRALRDGGVYTVWSEDPAPSFERRLSRLGFAVRLVRLSGGGPRHAVYVAHKQPVAHAGSTAGDMARSAPKLKKPAALLRRRP